MLLFFLDLESCSDYLKMQFERQNFELWGKECLYKRVCVCVFVRGIGEYGVVTYMTPGFL